MENGPKLVREGGARSMSPPKSALDVKFGNMSERLRASETLVENLASQVIDLRSQVLASVGRLEKDEVSPLLQQVEDILKNQSHLQELTHQLSNENTHLRFQVKEKLANALETPSPNRRSFAVLAKGVSPVSGPSHDDIMEEFVRSVDECKALNRQLSEKNKKLEKFSLVLASMERALVTSERQRLVAERKIQDLNAEIVSRKQLPPTSSQSPTPTIPKNSFSPNAGSAEDGGSRRGNNSSLTGNGTQLATRPGGEGNRIAVASEDWNMSEKLLRCQKERDDARGQLHNALTLLERQAQISGAIQHLGNQEQGTGTHTAFGQDAVHAGTLAQTDAHSSSALQKNSKMSLRRDETTELEALRLGSLVASQWREESQETSEKLRRVQEALDLALSENSSLRSHADSKQRNLESLEETAKGLQHEINNYAFKERALLEAQKQMEGRMSELQHHNASLLRKRTEDLEQMAELETRAYVAEHELHSSQATFMQAQEELYLTREEKDSLTRQHSHLRNMAKIFAPSSIVVRETNHYTLDNVIVKNKSHVFREANPRGSHAYMSTVLNPHTNTSPAHTEGISPGKGGDKNGGFTRVEGVGGTPSKRPVSAHVDKARSPSKVGRESGGTREGRPGWRVVGPYASSPLSSRSPYGNPYGRPRARSSDPHSSPH